jgi:hypothetical protein
MWVTLIVYACALVCGDARVRIPCARVPCRRLPSRRSSDAECDRLQATPAHRTKLLASAARLASRLRERGRALPKSGGGGGEVYAAAAQLHYDADSGTFWDEGGMAGAAAADGGGDGGGEGVHHGSGQGGGGQGGGGPRPPMNPALARRRTEANKAKVANHSRKQAAARKQHRAGGFV